VLEQPLGTPFILFRKGERAYIKVRACRARLTAPAIDRPQRRAGLRIVRSSNE
jgi:hypothetical protein